MFLKVTFWFLRFQKRMHMERSVRGRVRGHLKHPVDASDWAGVWSCAYMKKTKKRNIPILVFQGAWKV